MSILRKFINIFRGKALKLADALEDNVETVELKLVDMQSQVVKITSSLAPILGSIQRLEYKHTVLEKELNEITTKLDMAVANSNDDLAMKYLAERKAKQAEIQDLKTILDQNKATAQTGQQTLDTLKKQIDDLKRYKDSVKLRSQAALATSELNELLLKSGASVGHDGHLQLDSIEDKLNAQQDTANGLQKLVGDNLNIVDVAYEVDLSSELEEYKRQRGGQLEG